MVLLKAERGRGRTEMKRVLITGAGSYIGERFGIFCQRNPEFEVCELDVKDSKWREYDFSTVDTVFHVAGIAHMNEKKVPMELYESVNHKLANEVATLAKKAGVRHFIFMSSMSVYGMNTGIIDKATEPLPNTKYGISKLRAETEIIKLSSEDFIISILRPPMVYGKNSRGNFSKLLEATQKFPFFIEFENQRSMIHIDNLVNFVVQVITNRVEGILFPQNAEYVSTYQMVKLTATLRNQLFWSLPIPRKFISEKFINKLPVINKLLGNLTYEKSMSVLLDSDGQIIDYCLLDFRKSIEEAVL